MLQAMFPLFAMNITCIKERWKLVFHLMNLCKMFVEEKREKKKWRTGNERGRLDLYDSLDPIT